MSSKRPAPDADESQRKRIAADAAKREWTECLENDKITRNALSRIGAPSQERDRMFAMLDEMLLGVLEKILRHHALAPQTGKQCTHCNKRSIVINGARCRSCWIRPVNPDDSCIYHQWCDLCECSAATDEDVRMCNLERKCCPDCTSVDDPCDEHDADWENYVCENDNPMYRPWGMLDAVRARHRDGAPDARNGVERALDPTSPDFYLNPLK